MKAISLCCLHCMASLNLIWGVRDYRLDMVDKVGINLYDTWRDAVDVYFYKEDWILNLASKEYAKMVNHPKVVTD